MKSVGKILSSVMACHLSRCSVWGLVSNLRRFAASTRLYNTEGSNSFLSATAVTNLPDVPEGARRVLLMRHGESEFNNANVFTGWCDVALTQRGIVEAVEAGQVFYSHKMVFRRAFASLLTRSIVTAHRSLEAAGVAHTPISYDWRLNERHYGALQGLSKERTAERLGRSVVMEWRRSYEARPPLMTKDHPHYPIIYSDPRYKRIHDMDLPIGESLADCQLRVVSAWEDIMKDLSTEDQVADEEPGYTLIVAHANSLRALVMHLDDIPSGEIEAVNIPTAIPFFYDISLSSMSVVSDKAKGAFRGVYISDDRKKRNYLERRRAANDPFLWALFDHQVSSSMLIGDGDDGSGKQVEGMDGIEEEAKHNTQLYSSVYSEPDETGYNRST